jgi:hypothetical protein
MLIPHQTGGISRHGKLDGPSVVGAIPKTYSRTARIYPDTTREPDSGGLARGLLGLFELAAHLFEFVSL